MPSGELQVMEAGRPAPQRYGRQGHPYRWGQSGGGLYGGSSAPIRRVAQGDSYVDRSEYSDLTEEALRPGAQVRHKDFGVGEVIKARPESGNVVVEFPDHGTKTIRAGFLEPA
jgi:hypothetical protein